MKICTKCKEERTTEQFYTYWHSTQKKYRTRLICKLCTQLQTKLYKRKIKNIKNNIPEHTELCPSCKKDLPMSSYYIKSYVKGRYCKTCLRINYDKKRYEHIMSNGGSERISTQPNTYADEYQKVQTYYVLETLGWVFHEDTGIWSKEGVKSKDNVWVGIDTQTKRKKRPTGITIKKKHGVHNYIPQIVRQREQGMTYGELADIYCCSHTTIRMIISNYYREKKTR